MRQRPDELNKLARALHPARLHTAYRPCTVVGSVARTLPARPRPRRPFRRRSEWPGPPDPGGEPVLVAEVANKRCHVKGVVLGRHGVRNDLEGLYRGVPDAAVLDQAKALQRLKERVGELLPANGRDKLAYRGSDGLEYVVVIVAGLCHERHELIWFAPGRAPCRCAPAT